MKKINKKSTKLCLLLICFTFALLTLNIKVSGHDQSPDVTFEDCVSGNRWFKLLNWHISDEVPTIKYYFCEGLTYNELGIYSVHNFHSWTVSKPSGSYEISEIKQYLSEGIRNWGNIKIAQYDSSGQLLGYTQLVNVEEGNRNDYNVIICPHQNLGGGTVADMWRMNMNLNTYHADHFRFRFDAEHFFNEYGIVRDPDEAISVASHEIGHMLGLNDMYADLCNGSMHYHDEILMGYNSTITYKDVAGVSINRGIHTDSDHIWQMYKISNNKYYVRCLLCNGIKSVTALAYSQSYSLVSCSPTSHSSTGGNLIPVASMGDQHVLRCKFCDTFVYEDHDYEWNYNLHSHMWKCTICAAEKETVSHTMVYTGNITDEGHERICVDCDYLVYITHAFYYTPIYRFGIPTLQHEKRCWNCDFYVKENHEPLPNGENCCTY